MGHAYRSTFLFILLFSCTKQDLEYPKIPEEVILARIGPEVITIQDFIRRSEYTIRPKYCRQDNYIHKKIILNSLIGEKLTSIEQEKQNIEISAENLDTYFKGRREQAMRQMFYAKEFHSKVTVPEKEVKKAFKVAGRKVKVQFLNLPDKDLVNKIKNLDSKEVPLDSIYNVLWGGNAPVREITWFDRENDYIHNALFDENIEKGNMLGPYKTEDNTFILMKVLGWTDEIKITESERELLWRDTNERLVEKKAKKNYLSWVKDLMKNKKMKLNPDIFYEYAEKAADYFFKMDSVKEDMLNQVLWDDHEFDTHTFNSDKDVNEDDVILYYDGATWTVGELNKQLSSHPLVFRKRKMKRSEFPQQLRLAIADLIRDTEITKQCYAKGYDKHWSVSLNEDMWRSSSNSKRYLSAVRSSNKQINDQDQWLRLMNPKIDSLQNVYSDQIEINMEAFEKIELTSTDMMVIQRGVPYPILVPSFPVITSDNKLDYGKKMN